MSFVLIAPEFVTAAAGDLTNLGSSISAANASAASATTQVLAAGADEVSARIAALFGGFGLEYQAISAQVAAYHQRFVQALSTGAGAYASAEAAAAEQIVLGVINAPTQALLGRPLIGDGANATTNRCHRRHRVFRWSRRGRRGRRQHRGWRHQRLRRARRHRRRGRRRWCRRRQPHRHRRHRRHRRERRRRRGRRAGR
ncbi:PE family protein [Mycobacterium tuberculosis]